MGSEYAVELRGISKTYPGSAIEANSNISLGIRRGEILCIAGENGAGKTTLMKILSGLEAPSAGEIFINGSAVSIDSPHAAQRLGLGMVHQHFMLFPDYTVAENITLGMEPRKWGVFFDGARAKAEAAKIIEAHHFSVAPDKPVRALTVGEMQQVEICRLLYRSADIIILDEPSAVLAEQEIAALFKTLKALARDGKSLFLITHKLREIKQVSDRVAVLRQGALAGICDTKSTSEYEISRMMLGNAAGNAAGSANVGGAGASVGSANSGSGADGIAVGAKNGSAAGSAGAGGRVAPAGAGGSSAGGIPVIAFDNVTVLRRGQKQPLLDRVSFAARAGEIVGFAGVGGNGLGVVEAVLGGFLHPSAGKVAHNGKDISRLNIRRLRRQGLAYVPADRLRVGSALGAAVDENIVIDRRKEFSRLGFLSSKAIKKFSASLIEHYRIAGAVFGGAVAAGALSGGNLQKLILAREIDQFKDYIVFSEPTWGLDISAGAFVWGEISKLREKGAAVILISTNLDEILALATRIIVMYRGGIAAEFANDSPGAPAASLKQEIGNCMQGLSRAWQAV